MPLKPLVKSALWRAGLDVRLRRNVVAAARRDWAGRWADDWRFLEGHAVRTIVDVGANTGQFAEMIRRVCPDARLYCFEPVRECFLALERTVAGLHGARAFNLALGDHKGPVEILRNAFTPCSSMLEPTALLEREYPEAARRERETVSMSTLDAALRGLDLSPPLLVKIDVEGYEPQVIRGAEATLDQALFVAVEIHFREYYKGQPLFDDIYRLMVDRGFVYRGSAGQYSSPADRHFSYADAVFENRRGRAPE
jgi:FkbM family methyltransferase